jgi:hypothetical protein
MNARSTLDLSQKNVCDFIFLPRESKPKNTLDKTAKVIVATATFDPTAQ